MSDQRVIAFSTFLKLVELDDQKKMAALRGFKRGGGFNYWRPLQVLSSEIIKNQLTLEDLSSRLDTFAKGHQKKYNERALLKILLWKSKRKVNARRRPERFEYRLGSSGFTVKFEPELSFELNGSNYLAHVWATNTPTLSETSLSVGLYLLKLAARKNGLIDYNYLILDTVKDRTFGEFDILANSEDMLNDQISILGDLWSDSVPDRRRGERSEDLLAPPPAF
ncbi:MAG: hypothetical protein AAF423_05185 [Pseudomonadota bacterium]